MPKTDREHRALLWRGRTRVFALLLASAFLLAGPASAQFQQSPALRNPNIAYDYYEPRDPGYAQLYNKLQKRQILEELGQFLGPVRWPHKLRLLLKQCPGTTAEPQVFYSNIEYSITLCYQWFARVERFAPPNAALGTFPQALVGGVVGVVLHEAARAIFDMRNIPRLGSDDDAADQMTAFVGLQFGSEVAQTVIKGTYWVWANYDLITRQRNKPDASPDARALRRSECSTPPASLTGADPTAFKDFAPLLPGRTTNCASEYQQVQYAFDKTIKPYVDLALMKKAQSISWLSPEDLK